MGRAAAEGFWIARLRAHSNLTIVRRYVESAPEAQRERRNLLHERTETRERPGRRVRRKAVALFAAVPPYEAPVNHLMGR